MKFVDVFDTEGGEIAIVPGLGITLETLIKKFK